MTTDDPIAWKDDIEAVLSDLFPVEVGRFCLYLPPEAGSRGEDDPARRQIAQEGDMVCLVVEALVYKADTRDGSAPQVESIRQQNVRLVPRAALPISRARLASYLQAVAKCIEEQDFESLEELPPGTWFLPDLLELDELVSADDFYRFIARRLPTPKGRDPRGPEVAMVLLGEPGLPLASDLERAFASADPTGRRVEVRNESDGILALDVGPGDRLWISRMPGPVPADDAEAAARFSVARFGSPTPPTPAHRAHLLVALESTNARSLERRTSLVRCTAAVTEASSAIGVYLSGVTHPASFFLKHATSLPMILLCGASVATGGDGRQQILSRGMTELGLLDLLLTTTGPIAQAFQFFFELLELVARRGTPLPAGDTVGRTEREKLKVRYQPSPADPAVQVWRVDLPD